MSLREIAMSQGISEGAIRKRAKRDEWSRDIAERVRVRADELVRKAEVRSEVRTDERVLIEAGAEAIAAVKLSHRSDIRRYRSLVNSLLSELEQQTGSLELYERLGELMSEDSQDAPDKLNELYRKVIGLPQRTKVMIDLANALKVLITLERESYGITDAQRVELTGKDGKPIQNETTITGTVSLTDGEKVAAIRQRLRDSC
ncbi:hypothetical protein JOS77_29075 [Chromobacterium haemolyticum]|nr:hypothetical protein JOS77_29075 [Chromobacterium haemolyticum]